MKTPLLVSLPSPLPPLIDDNDRIHNSRDNLSPTQKQFLTERLLKLKSNNRILAIIILANTIILFFSMQFLSENSPVLIVLLTLETLGLPLCLATRNRARELEADINTGHVEKVILRNFFGWTIKGSKLFGSLINISGHKDLRPGIRYMLPKSKLIIGVDDKSPLSVVESSSPMPTKRILWDTLGWVLIQKLAFWLFVTGILFSAQKYFALPFFTETHAFLLGVIIVAVINFSPHLPTARALIKDLWRTEVKVTVGFPSNMTSFMMKRGRGRGVDTYTNFTINDTRLTVDTSEFMLIQGDKKYEIRFFANSKIILSVNLA